MVIVLAVVGRAVMVVAQMDGVLRRRFEPDQQRQIELAARRAHDLHLRRDLVADRGLDVGELRVGDEVGLVHITRSADDSWSANSSCSGDSWSRFGSARRCASTACGSRRTGRWLRPARRRRSPPRRP
jgi:hypothetical protein